MKKISLDAIFKYSLLAFVFLVFHTTKYSGRVIEFLMIPCFILKIIKERNYIKTGLELPLGGFILSIYLSSINSFHSKSVFDFGKDTFKFFGLPLFISQFDLGLKDQKRVLYVGLLSFILKLSKAFLEKTGYIEGLYRGIRISGGEEVWRYTGVVMCGLVINLVILFFKKNSKFEMTLLTLLSLISGIVLLWTQNRGNWVGLSAALSFILLIKLNKNSIPIFILAIFLMCGSIYYLPQNVYVKRIKSIVNLKTNKSNLGRIDLWKGSLRMYRENPVM